MKPRQQEAYEKVDYEGYFLGDGSVACSLAAYKEKDVWTSEPFNYIVDTEGRVSQLSEIDFSKVSTLENNQISGMFSTDEGDLYIEDMEGAGEVQVFRCISLPNLDEAPNGQGDVVRLAAARSKPRGPEQRH